MNRVYFKDGEGVIISLKTLNLLLLYFMNYLKCQQTPKHILY